MRKLPMGFLFIVSAWLCALLSACSVDSSTTEFHAYNPMVNSQATAIAQKAMDEAASAALLRKGIEQQVRDEAFKRSIDLAAQQAKNVLEIKTATNIEADVDAKRDAEIIQLQAQADTEIKAQPAKLAGKSTWYVLSWTGAGVGLLVLAVGMAFAVVAWTNKRATTIYPNKQGQFPVIVRRGLGWVIFHDPSRNIGAGAVYRVPTLADPFLARLGLPSAEAHYPLPAVSEHALLAVSSQSNVTATVAAQNRWPELPEGFMARNMRLTTNTRATGDERPLLPATITATDPATGALLDPLPSRVPLHGLMNGRPSSLSRLALGVGMSNGQLTPVTGNLSQMVHILAAGASGWGKSQFLKMLVYQIATSTESCQLVLADMERTTFGAFGQSNRLMFPIIDTEQDLAAVLAELNRELTRRKEMFSGFPDVDTLEAYNTRVSDAIAPIVLAIDEATSFLVDDGVSDGLRTLVRRGRKYGLWVTAGGQTFSSKDVDAATSLQFSSRIQFRAPVKSAQQTLVDSKEARTLECPGRAILVLPGRDAVKIQTPTVTYDEIVSALQGGQPANPIPTPTIKTSDAAGNPYDVEDTIRELSAQGKSRRAIEWEVFGYHGGVAFETVKRVLGATTTTD